jgi:hypothetical protein
LFLFFNFFHSFVRFLILLFSRISDLYVNYPAELQLRNLPCMDECPHLVTELNHYFDGRLQAGRHGGVMKVRTPSTNISPTAPRTAYVAMHRMWENIWLFDRLRNFSFGQSARDNAGQCTISWAPVHVHVQHYGTITLSDLRDLVVPLDQMHPATIDALNLRGYIRLAVDDGLRPPVEIVDTATQTDPPEISDSGVQTDPPALVALRFRSRSTVAD